MFNSKGGFGQGGFGGNDSMSAGGGFLTSPGKSPITSTQGDRKRAIQNLMPVTVAQVLKIPDGDEQLKVGSLSAHMVSLVGKVLAVDEQTTRITYRLDDMTGPPLEVQLWMGDNDDVNAENRTLIVENMYVRVLGAVRSLKGQRLVSAFKILPVLDLNEISMHILEVVHTHMSVALMDKEPADEKMDTSGFMGTASKGGMMQQMGTSDNTLGLDKQQNMVYQAIFTVQTEDGISVDALCNNLKSLPRSTISEHLKFLCNEGHIYTTIDDDHYKTIDSM